MRTLLAPLLLIALGVGCHSWPKSPLSGREEKAIKAILAARQVVLKVNTNASWGIIPAYKLEDLGRPPMTTETYFASRCPYDGTINLSKSCLPTGSWSINGTNVSQWTISYICWRPTCTMHYSDYRLQILPDTQSVRLPIIGQ